MVKRLSFSLILVISLILVSGLVFGQSLVAAASSGNMRIVKLLIEQGVDVNEVDRNGYTELLYAVSGYRWDVAKYLVESGANIFIKNNDGDMAINIASRQWGSDEFINYLLDIMYPED